MQKPTLLVIVGATAVGKTAACIQLAQALQTVIISADSRQLYKEMSIGTAKPTIHEQAGIPHYFIDSHHITDDYNAGQFEKDVLVLLEQLFETMPVVIMTGGSGLYVQAVAEGFDEMPEVPEQLREEIATLLTQKGLEYLLEELAKVDAVYYQQVDKANPQRVMRALEVCWATGVPYSSFRQHQKPERPFHIIKIGLERPREELYQRIDTRIDLMLTQGLRQEAELLYAYRHHNALQTVGYKEIFDYLEGQYDWEECVRLLKRNSRRYAKRQLTWFRRDTSIQWLKADDLSGILAFVKSSLATLT